MTAKQMIPAIGAVVFIEIGLGDLFMQVEVLDVKNSWGTPRLLVTPIAGQGKTWVDVSRLRRGDQFETAGTIKGGVVVAGVKL